MHPFQQITVRGFNGQVVVILHQAMSMQFQLRLFTHHPQTVNRPLSRACRFKQILPIVSAVQDMVDRAGDSTLGFLTMPTV